MEINLAATTKKTKQQKKTERTLIVLAEEFVFSRLLFAMPVEELDDGNRFTLKVETKVLPTNLVRYIPVIGRWFFFGVIGFGSVAVTFG